MSFLNKYFGLNNFISQNNNYVVFDEFFDLISNSKNNITYDNDTNRAINRLNNYNNYRDIENNKNYEMNDYNYNRNIRGNNMNMNYENQNNNDNNMIQNENNFRYNNNTNQNNVMPNEMNNNNNNELNNNFNRTTPSINNNNINNNRTSMSQVGEKLIYNNTFNNNVVNKEVYKHPLTGFQNYYLNNDASTAYDNIYSRQKINLINDYLSSKKQTEEEYINEQYGLKENNINNSNGRLNDLMNKISDITTENRLNGKDLFNKRNQYATLFDDKKLAEYSYNRQQNLKNLGANNNIITENDFTNYQMNRVINGKKSPQRLQHYTPFSRLGKVYTTVLPTSSSAYGACYHNNEINNGDQSPNRLYY